MSNIPEIPNQKNYENLTPFDLVLIQKFPFIEEDFDQINLYGILSKIKECLNKVIKNEQTVTENQENLYNSFVDLHNYVEDYFTNLNVQEEINNKLDEMLNDGTLQEIITTFLNTKTFLVFKNVEDLKNSRNLIDGSFAETLGFYDEGDFGNAKYKIRKITNNDVVDNQFIIPLVHFNNLIAEIINDNSIINAKKLGLKTNGDDNTSLFNNIINKVKANTTLYFPKGIYTFNSPITINKKLNLEGEEISITDTDKTLASILYFEGNNFNENSTCITLPNTKLLIKNLSIYGNFYELSDNRNLCAKGIDVFTENIIKNNVNGLKLTHPSYGTTIKNCRFRGFSGQALNCSTFAIVENCSFWQNAEGIHLFSDCTICNNRFFHNKVGINVAGSNNIITNIRMDSIKETGILINSANSNIVDNVNIDYCQYNAIKIHNGRNNTISNIKARCGTIFPFDTTEDGTNINDLSTFENNENFNDYKKYLGIVLLTGYANYGNEITVPVNPRNPKDTESSMFCSLFGSTIAEGQIRNVKITGTNAGVYSLVSSNNNFYKGYMKFLCYIASGSVLGNFDFCGRKINANSSISSWSDSLQNCYISDMSIFDV